MVSVSAKKVKKKFHACVPLKLRNFSDPSIVGLYSCILYTVPTLHAKIQALSRSAYTVCHDSGIGMCAFTVCYDSGIIKSA
jgi:hypothetical protein